MIRPFRSVTRIRTPANSPSNGPFGPSDSLATIRAACRRSASAHSGGRRRPASSARSSWNGGVYSVGFSSSSRVRVGGRSPVPGVTGALSVDAGGSPAGPAACWSSTGRWARCWPSRTMPSIRTPLDRPVQCTLPSGSSVELVRFR